MTTKKVMPLIPSARVGLVAEVTGWWSSERFGITEELQKLIKSRYQPTYQRDTVSDLRLDRWAGAETSRNCSCPVILERREYCCIYKYGSLQSLDEYACSLSHREAGRKEGVCTHL